jgi:putative SOS response-associated peptidase YedK
LTDPGDLARYVAESTAPRHIAGVCARTTLTLSAHLIARWLALQDVPEWEPRYNVCPTQDQMVVRARDGEPEAVKLRWGLVPWWASDLSVGSRMINARAEGVDTKPAFRDAFRERRCLVLVDGFYEWQAIPGEKRRRPYAVRMPDNSPFVLAGLWESWRNRTTREVVQTCTVVTTTPNAFMARLHDRMPVILDPASYGAWLNPATPSADAMSMLRPYDGAAALSAYPVSAYVNSPAHDDAKCLEPEAA